MKNICILLPVLHNHFQRLCKRKSWSIKYKKTFILCILSVCKDTAVLTRRLDDDIADFFLSAESDLRKKM